MVITLTEIYEKEDENHVLATPALSHKETLPPVITSRTDANAITGFTWMNT